MKGNISQEETQAARQRVGQQLRQAREARGLTQRDLSELMGIRQGTVASLENGDWSASLDKLTLFCKHLGLSIELVKDKND